MFTFLLVVQAIVAALLVTVILMQKSEGGGLGVGGSPSGFMSARGAAELVGMAAIRRKRRTLFSVTISLISGCAEERR